jgi:hypothetical protein
MDTVQQQNTVSVCYTRSSVPYSAELTWFIDLKTMFLQWKFGLSRWRVCLPITRSNVHDPAGFEPKIRLIDLSKRSAHTFPSLKSLLRWRLCVRSKRRVTSHCSLPCAPTTFLDINAVQTWNLAFRVLALVWICCEVESSGNEAVCPVSVHLIVKPRKHHCW